MKTIGLKNLKTCFWSLMTPTQWFLNMCHKNILISDQVLFHLVGMNIGEEEGRNKLKSSRLILIGCSRSSSRNCCKVKLCSKNVISNSHSHSSNSSRMMIKMMLWSSMKIIWNKSWEEWISWVITKRKNLKRKSSSLLIFKLYWWRRSEKENH